MIRRGLLVLGVLVGAAVLLPTAAAAAATPAQRGWMTATQDTFAHRLTVRGAAYDTARPAASVSLGVYVDGRWVRTVRADGASAGYDKAQHISGRHNFLLTVIWTPRAGSVTVRTRGADGAGAAVVVQTQPVAHTMPPAGARIVSIAAKYVGKARYVEGGSTPAHGFDCSGYTMYAYAQAGVRTLPHNADAQRRAMKRISAASARPGDLVFYVSGGSAFHVAIYAGHHMQYAAATARDGVRYQQVWSSDVVYGTDWH